MRPFGWFTINRTAPFFGIFSFPLTIIFFDIKNKEVFKRILKKIIVTLYMQKIAYFLFNIYTSIFRYHTVQRDSIFFALDLKESVDRGIFLAGWEPLTIKWLNENLHSGDVVIEVGANVGAHSLIISKIID